ncbi:hypothetical protein B0H13DRAFT_1855610 [Mycena leptocephala]|nr:hypothetical protein B0H13DRAFT_1855610 [Mycena leptocephala]
MSALACRAASTRWVREGAAQQRSEAGASTDTGSAGVARAPTELRRRRARPGACRVGGLGAWRGQNDALDAPHRPLDDAGGVYANRFSTAKAPASEGEVESTQARSKDGECEHVEKKMGADGLNQAHSCVVRATTVRKEGERSNTRGFPFWEARKKNLVIVNNFYPILSPDVSKKSPIGQHIPTPQYCAHTRKFAAAPAARNGIVRQWFILVDVAWEVSIGLKIREPEHNCTVPSGEFVSGWVQNGIRRSWGRVLVG